MLHPGFLGCIRWVRALSSLSENNDTAGYPLSPESPLIVVGQTAEYSTPGLRTATRLESRERPYLSNIKGRGLPSRLHLNTISVCLYGIYATFSSVLMCLNKHILRHRSLWHRALCEDLWSGVLEPGWQCGRLELWLAKCGELQPSFLLIILLLLSQPAPGHQVTPVSSI